jgi:hypothetical protein
VMFRFFFIFVLFCCARKISGAGGILERTCARPSPAQRVYREVDLFGPDAHENATPKAVKVSAATKSQKKKKTSFFFLKIFFLVLFLVLDVRVAHCRNKTQEEKKKKRHGLHICERG